jgi:hypothetical protein
MRALSLGGIWLVVVVRQIHGNFHLPICRSSTPRLYFGLSPPDLSEFCSPQILLSLHPRSSHLQVPAYRFQNTKTAPLGILVLTPIPRVDLH